MNSNDPLQQNIRRTAGAHALRQIRVIVDEENKNDAATADRTMNSNDPLQQNIRRSAGIHALRKIRVIVDEENRNDAATAHALRWMLRYGWIVLLLIVAVLARLMGVY